MEAPCIYCRLIVDLDGDDYIVLTGSGEWAAYAHTECQKIAEILAVEALLRQSA
jgi:hypothetical protein